MATGFKERAIARLRAIISQYGTPAKLPTVGLNSATRFINLMSAARYDYHREVRRYDVRWYPELDEVAATYPGWGGIFQSYQNHEQRGRAVLAAIITKFNAFEPLSTTEKLWLQKRTSRLRRGSLHQYLVEAAQAAGYPELFREGMKMAQQVQTFRDMVKRWSTDRQWLEAHKGDPFIQKLALTIGLDLAAVDDLAPIRLSKSKTIPAPIASLPATVDVPLEVRIELLRLEELVRACDGKPPTPATPGYDWLKKARRLAKQGGLPSVLVEAIRAVGWATVLHEEPSRKLDYREEVDERVCTKCKKLKPIQSFTTHSVSNGVRRRRKLCRACLRYHKE